MWDNLNDCRNQLLDTIVRFKGNPVRVVGVNFNEDGSDNYLTTVNSLYSGVLSKCNLGELDLSPMELGYVNARGSAIYVNRVPARRWKHGIDANSLNVRKTKRLHFSILKDAPRGFHNCVIGKYPSPREALDRAVEEHTSVAFARQFAVKFEPDRDHAKLFYKEYEIGTWWIGTDKPTIRRQFSFLNELLTQELVKHEGT